MPWIETLGKGWNLWEKVLLIPLRKGCWNLWEKVETFEKGWCWYLWDRGVETFGKRLGPLRNGDALSFRDADCMFHLGNSGCPMQWWPIQLLRHLVILVCFWAASTPSAYIHQACQTCIALQLPGFDHWIFDCYIAFFEFYVDFSWILILIFSLIFILFFSLIFILIFYLIFILIFAFSFPILFIDYFSAKSIFSNWFFLDFGTILILLIVINIRCSGYICKDGSLRRGAK